MLRLGKTTPNFAFLAAGLLWAALVTAGFVILGREAYIAAPHAVTESAFPRDSSLALDPHHLTLLLFVHPHCPCTEATFANLEQVRTDTQNTLSVTIIFTLPPGVPHGWEKGSLLNAAHHMKSVHIFTDINGIEARRFGVTTSGHVLVYARNGRLLFSGGITPSRGHAGDSPGELAIVHITKVPELSDKVEMPVFGCTLL